LAFANGSAGYFREQFILQLVHGRPICNCFHTFAVHDLLSIPIGAIDIISRILEFQAKCPDKIEFVKIDWL
jgi:hypothetical protein